jgi:hypothetical protein
MPMERMMRQLLNDEELMPVAEEKENMMLL